MGLPDGELLDKGDLEALLEICGEEAERPHADPCYYRISQQLERAIAAHDDQRTGDHAGEARVNAIVIGRIPLDVDVNAGPKEKLNAAIAAAEDSKVYCPDGYEVSFEDVIDGEAVTA